MEVEFPESGTAEVSRFSISTHSEVTIQIVERDGRQLIVIREQTPNQSDALVEHQVEIPAAMLPELKRAVNVIEENFSDPAEPASRPSISFAHVSEEELARILDFYHIQWQYEPRTFRSNGIRMEM